MKLKHGKHYETADGVVYLVNIDPYGYTYSDNGDISYDLDSNDPSKPDLIRRHYKKPKPAHKLDLKEGDVVELVAWEDDATTGTGRTFECGSNGPISAVFKFCQPKGHRPLFRVVSRA